MSDNPRCVTLRDVVQIAEHSLDSGIAECGGNAVQNRIIREKVVTMNETDDFSGRMANPFVQGIVNSPVRFADQTHAGMAGALDGGDRFIL